MIATIFISIVFIKISLLFVKILNNFDWFKKIKGNPVNCKDILRPLFAISASQLIKMLMH
jgi:hypothetical protein